MPARAWGHSGHVMISRLAAQAFPDSLPAFVRTPVAVEQIAQLGAEADELKGAGRSFDRDENPGHFVDLDDSAMMMGVLTLASLPVAREDYDSALRAAGSDQYKMGYLPYSIVDGYQIVRKDFAWWRVADYGARNAADPRDRDFFASMRDLEQLLVIRDIGYWSHFVGDASQPLHTSIHYDGWIDRYPGSKGLHAHFESDYVSTYLDAATVSARMKPFAPCNCSIEQNVAAYLGATNSQVVPLYELFKQGAFASRTDAGVNFTADRLAAAASELRDLTVTAWGESAGITVGYPAVSVNDVLTGAVPITRAIYGRD